MNRAFCSRDPQTVTGSLDAPLFLQARLQQYAWSGEMLAGKVMLRVAASFSYVHFGLTDWSKAKRSSKPYTCCVNSSSRLGASMRRKRCTHRHVRVSPPQRHTTLPAFLGSISRKPCPHLGRACANARLTSPQLLPGCSDAPTSGADAATCRFYVVTGRWPALRCRAMYLHFLAAELSIAAKTKASVLRWFLQSYRVDYARPVLLP